MLVKNLLQVLRQGFFREDERLEGLENIGDHHVEQHASWQGEKQEHPRDHHWGDFVGGGLLGVGTVSYTHLTLPTILLV